MEINVKNYSYYRENPMLFFDECRHLLENFSEEVISQLTFKIGLNTKCEVVCFISMLEEFCFKTKFEEINLLCSLYRYMFIRYELYSEKVFLIIKSLMDKDYGGQNIILLNNVLEISRIYDFDCLKTFYRNWRTGLDPKSKLRIKDRLYGSSEELMSQLNELIDGHCQILNKYRFLTPRDAASILENKFLRNERDVELERYASEKFLKKKFLGTLDDPSFLKFIRSLKKIDESDSSDSSDSSDEDDNDSRKEQNSLKISSLLSKIEEVKLKAQKSLKDAEDHRRKEETSPKRFSLSSSQKEAKINDSDSDSNSDSDSDKFEISREFFQHEDAKAAKAARKGNFYTHKIFHKTLSGECELTIDMAISNQRDKVNLTYRDIIKTSKEIGYMDGSTLHLNYDVLDSYYGYLRDKFRRLRNVSLSFTQSSEGPIVSIRYLR